MSPHQLDSGVVDVSVHSNLRRQRKNFAIRLYAQALCLTLSGVKPWARPFLGLFVSQRPCPGNEDSTLSYYQGWHKNTSVCGKVLYFKEKSDVFMTAFCKHSHEPYQQVAGDWYVTSSGPLCQGSNCSRSLLPAVWLGVSLKPLSASFLLFLK